MDQAASAPAGEARLAGRPTNGPSAAPVLGAIAVGGALGAVARYGVGLVLPHGPGFPWATFAVNVVGCLLLGVLVALLDARGRHSLARPFLGVGVLGGFTTFSAYTAETLALAHDGALGTAVAYLAGTLLAAVIAVHTGATGARLLATSRTSPPVDARDRRRVER